MKIDQLELEVLNMEDLVNINAGESGWYYLGKAVKAFLTGCENAVKGF